MCEDVASKLLLLALNEFNVGKHTVGLELSCKLDYRPDQPVHIISFDELLTRNRCSAMQTSQRDQLQDKAEVTVRSMPT